jgi:TRAP-type mannitol/chloroaromatic compound transport system permease small subunit
MKFLLQLSKWIDAINDGIGKVVSWALLAAVLICVLNASITFTLHQSSNAWREIQWYLFGSVFLLGAAHTLRKNEHVRIDVISGRFSKRIQAMIDIFGFLCFLLPMTLLLVYLSWPYAMDSIHNQEMSSNAGGLIKWPAKLLLPIGFILLSAQGLSELIKRFAFLAGLIDSSVYERQALTPEDEIEAIKNAKPALSTKNATSK